MDRENRPHGREKNVTSGGGEVHRRGEGLNLGGPVGSGDGYQGRQQGNMGGGPNLPGGNIPGMTGSQNEPQDRAGLSGGGNLLGTVGMGLLMSMLSKPKNGRRGGGLSKLLPIILIVIVGYYALQFFGAQSGGNAQPASIFTGNSETGGGSGSGGSSWNNGYNDPTHPNAYLDDGQNQVAGSDVNTTVSNRARDKRVTPLGNGRDRVTVMIYMCGTDLESRGGMASSDLQEMVNAMISDDKVNIIVETGGAKRWQNSIVKNSTNQRYRVHSKGLELLEDNLGRRPMTDPNTLSDFIQFSKQNYPADRYNLILWDHGGGSLTAYGYDEQFPQQGSMSLDKLNTALKNGGCTFDFIGFDACLMATLETAMVFEQYADYLIASEETEPGYGWYYTNWLNALSKDTSTSTLDLGKIIIDDFVNVSARQAPRNSTTLSIIDLAEMAGTVPEALNRFSNSTAQLIDTDKYKIVASARGKAQEFAKAEGINQVDLIDLAQNVGSSEGKELASALRECVKYNLTSPSMKRAYGISIYFPYSGSGELAKMLSTYKKIGMDESYSRCIKNFANTAAGGQMLSGGSSPLGSLLGSMVDGQTGGGGYSGGGSQDVLGGLLGSLAGGSQQQAGGSDLLGALLGGGSGSSGYSSGGGDILGSLLGGGSSSGGSLSGGMLGSLLGGGGSSSGSQMVESVLGGILSGRQAPAAGSDDEWLDSERIMKSAEYYANNMFDPSKLVTVKDSAGNDVIQLSEEQWDIILNVELNVFLDDGEGFIDLGLDNVYDFNDGGDLIMDYDNTWLAINGQVVSYYMLSEEREGDSYTIMGRIPAKLNGELVDIMVQFDNEQPNGTVLGARINYGGEVGTQAKGLIPIQEGDKLDFICDYYSYDGAFKNNFYIGEQLVVSGELSISNVDIGKNYSRATYRLTDMYQNYFWTPVIK